MILLDTNILLRHASAADPLYAIADAAISVLKGRRQKLTIVPQNLYEFWSAATRPANVNGLGFSVAECITAVGRIKKLFHLKPDQPTLFAEWESLVMTYQCQGKTAHDARLVAAMRTHGLSSILTFNFVDFQRYPGLTIIDPAAL